MLEHDTDEPIVPAAAEKVLVHRYVRQQAEAGDEHHIIAVDGHPAVARVARRATAAGTTLVATDHRVGHDDRAGRGPADDSAVTVARADGVQHGRAEDRGRQAVLVAARKPDARRLAEQTRDGVRAGVPAIEVQRDGMRRAELSKRRSLLRACLGTRLAGHRQDDDARLAGTAGELEKPPVDCFGNRTTAGDDEMSLCVRRRRL